jgi:hypothetical protein
MRCGWWPVGPGERAARRGGPGGPGERAATPPPPPPPPHSRGLPRFVSLRLAARCALCAVRASTVRASTVRAATQVLSRFPGLHAQEARNTYVRSPQHILHAVRCTFIWHPGAPAPVATGRARTRCPAHLPALAFGKHLVQSVHGLYAHVVLIPGCGADAGAAFSDAALAVWAVWAV